MPGWIFKQLFWVKQKLLRKRSPNQISSKSYAKWINSYEKSSINPNFQESNLKYRPLISIIVPISNVKKESVSKAIESIFKQTYSNWEICLSYDGSINEETKQIFKQYEIKDSRIKTVHYKGGRSSSAALNLALETGEGEFVVLVHQIDQLSPNALYEAVRVLNDNSELDLIYSDSDKITKNGKRTDPHFKPDWSPDLILNQNFISQLGVYRKSIATEINGFNTNYDGIQEHDFVLRYTELVSPQKIHHIPKVLYHSLVEEKSKGLELEQKKNVSEMGIKAVQTALNRRNIKGYVTQGRYQGIYDIKYEIIGTPLVSIIIPTKNGYHYIKQCVDSIFEKSTYRNFEIIIADNGSDDPRLEDLFSYYSSILKSRFKSVKIIIPFNYSKINNLAVKESEGEYLLFLNNDTSVITPSWIEELLGFAQFDRIGCVGAKLWYNDYTIQHGGVVLGIGGIAGHAFLNAKPEDSGYCNQLYTDYNYTAVTAACLMVSRKDFEQVQGFDESLSVAYNDVDFCIRIFKLGRTNVWAHNCELYHYESKSRGYEDTPEKRARSKKESFYVQSLHGEILNNDPAYNSNFTLSPPPFKQLRGGSNKR